MSRDKVASDNPVDGTSNIVPLPLPNVAALPPLNILKPVARGAHIPRLTDCDRFPCYMSDKKRKNFETVLANPRFRESLRAPFWDQADKIDEAIEKFRSLNPEMVVGIRALIETSKLGLQVDGPQRNLELVRQAHADCTATIERKRKANAENPATKRYKELHAEHSQLMTRKAQLEKEIAEARQRIPQELVSQGSAQDILRLLNGN